MQGTAATTDAAISKQHIKPVLVYPIQVMALFVISAFPRALDVFHAPSSALYMFRTRQICESAWVGTLLTKVYHVSEHGAQCHTAPSNRPFHFNLNVIKCRRFPLHVCT